MGAPYETPVRDRIVNDLLGNQNIDAQFRMILAGVRPSHMADAEKIQRLRSSVKELLELLDSFEDVTPSRHTDPDEAKQDYIDAIAHARSALEATQ